MLSLLGTAAMLVAIAICFYALVQTASELAASWQGLPTARPCRVEALPRDPRHAHRTTKHRRAA